MALLPNTLLDLNWPLHMEKLRLSNGIYSRNDDLL